MTAWIMSIVGVACLGVLLDIILPEGQTNKYVKGVFALMVIFVIIAPLPKLVKKDIDFDSLMNGVSIDQSYLSQTIDVQKTTIENNLENVLLENKLKSTVTLKIDKSNTKLKILSISVKPDKSVMNENSKNKIETDVKKIITEKIKIEKEKIIFVWS